MKKFKSVNKIISLLIVSLISSLFIGGCGSSQESQLSKIKKSGKIVLGTCADYPPYEFHKSIDGKDEVIGFDIEIAKEIAKDLGVKLEIKDMKFDGLLPALNSGNIDMIIAGMNPTPERSKNVDFTNIYYKAIHAVLVNPSDKDKYKTLKDLNGLKIGVQKGTVQEKVAKEQIKSKELKSLPKVTDLVLALQNKKVDAIIMEYPVASAYAKNTNSVALTDIKLGNDETGSAVALKKGSKDLTEKINKTIDRLSKENKINEAVAKYTQLSEK